MASEAETDELLTVGDAGNILRLSVAMVRVLHAKGLLEAIRTPRGYRLFRRSDVERLARERETRISDSKQPAAPSAELFPSEQRFHQLVDAVSDYAIYMLDATGHVVTWNAGAQKAKGYEQREILGQHFSAFYMPEDRAAGKPGRILETVRREGRFEEENWRVRKDGTRFWANVVITAVRDQASQIIGFAKVTRDLTAKRAADAERHASEQRFHQAGQKGAL
jgi:PAS domain S-box-containing protein